MATTALWQTLPVFWLTLRQFIAGRSLRLVTLLAAAPVLLGGIEFLRVRSDISSSNLSGIFLQLTIPTILPIAALVLATSAISNELSDRTMPYLALKPVARIRMLLEKIAASFLVTTAVIAVMSWVLWILVSAAGGSADVRLLLALFLAGSVGVAAYVALFSLLSLLVTRVLLAGLIYVLLWENLLARFIPGVRLVSVRHYAQSIFTGALNDPAVSISDQTGLGAALIVIAVTCAIAILLSWIRVQRMDLD